MIGLLRLQIANKCQGSNLISYLSLLLAHPTAFFVDTTTTIRGRSLSKYIRLAGLFCLLLCSLVIIQDTDNVCDKFSVGFADRPLCARPRHKTRQDSVRRNCRGESFIRDPRNRITTGIHTLLLLLLIRCGGDIHRYMYTHSRV